jgi:hypothetical protein
MLNCLMCLDFYRDLEAYLNEHRYQATSQEAQRHLTSIEALVESHSLHSLDFDTERI